MAAAPPYVPPLPPPLPPSGHYDPPPPLPPSGYYPPLPPTDYYTTPPPTTNVTVIVIVVPIVGVVCLALLAALLFVLVRRRRRRCQEEEEAKVDEVEDVEVKVTEHVRIVEGVVGEAGGGEAYGYSGCKGGAEAIGAAVVVQDDVKVEEHVVKYTEASKRG